MRERHDDAARLLPSPRIEVSPRRGLRREESARYVGVSASKFDEMVRDGRMPKPKRIDGCVVWDLRRLDLAWDALGGDDAGTNPWD
ncbi:helix-turn-helix transcriptional regulator [Methylobacterium brachiatum]|uniref:helix-turn-helix transcriptional regulator n=1 Tax=Methylobacterium brachiatum TaxID=269660 RepID=UPI000EFA9AB2|nr:XRE family transcriptional regulator [Methylobacterium brachiatum]AYO83692.1 XRE family transcriptional regulator [Methylobacterium brachiatum]